MPVKALTQNLYRHRQRVGEIGIGAFPVAVPFHHDPPAEQRVPPPAGPKLGACLRAKHPFRPRMAPLQQVRPKRRPVQLVDGFVHESRPNRTDTGRPTRNEVK